MEENKLIAEFMRVFPREGERRTNMKEWYSPIDLDSVGLPDKLTLVEDLDFKQWDWLMPVVEKIESLGYCYDRIDGDVFINKQSSLGGGSIIPNPMDHNTMTMLGKTYCVVVQFIEYYNNLNK